MKSLAEIQAELAEARKVVTANAGALRRVEVEVAKTADALSKAEGKHATSCEAFAKAEALVVANDADEKSLERYVEADARRTATGLIVGKATQAHAASTAAANDAQGRLDAATNAIASLERSIEAHPETLQKATAESCEAFLRAARTLVASYVDVEGKLREARVAALFDINRSRAAHKTIDGKPSPLPTIISRGSRYCTRLLQKVESCRATFSQTSANRRTCPGEISRLAPR
jgi:hypothetical protein